MSLMWSQGANHNKVLLFLIDAGSHVAETAKHLTVSYPIGFFTFRKQHWSYGEILLSEQVHFMLMYLFISRLNKHINSPAFLSQSHSPVYRLNNFI